MICSFIDDEQLAGDQHTIDPQILVHFTQLPILPYELNGVVLLLIGNGVLVGQVMQEGGDEGGKISLFIFEQRARGSQTDRRTF